MVLCREKSTREYWALKILAIADVIRLKQVQHVQNEKNILLSVNHPFIVNMSVLCFLNFVVYLMMKSIFPHRSLKLVFVLLLLLFFRVWTHHDQSFLYMLFDYVCGGELFSYLRNAGRFSSSTGRYNFVYTKSFE